MVHAQSTGVECQVFHGDHVAEPSVATIPATETSPCPTHEVRPAMSRQLRKSDTPASVSLGVLYKYESAILRLMMVDACERMSISFTSAWPRKVTIGSISRYNVRTIFSPIVWVTCHEDMKLAMTARFSSAITKSARRLLKNEARVQMQSGPRRHVNRYPAPLQSQSGEIGHQIELAQWTTSAVIFSSFQNLASAALDL